MEYAAEKRRFFRELVLKGADPKEFDAIAKSMDVGVPQEIIEKWGRRFYRTGKRLARNFEFTQEPRLINRFCVGADPEFAMAKLSTTNEGKPYNKYVHAEKLGLNTVDAFGCDMAGRQAELRAYPSRFVLEVVGSLMDTLRWMNEALSLYNYQWLAPSAFDRDGFGGHVHLGRKKGEVIKSVASLDVLTRCLLQTEILDNKGQKSRIEIGYGNNSDYRKQSHGYEYRTMPTWMSSPWAAYLTLTLSKLAVIEDLTAVPEKFPEKVIINLLRAYQGRDDDAKIALIALDKFGLPKYDPSDFKSRWGIPKNTKNGAYEEYYYPPIIKPSLETTQQLFEYFVHGTAIPYALPKPTWEPFFKPGNLWRPRYTPHVNGLPDVVSGMLTSVKDTAFGCSGHELMISDNVQLDHLAISRWMAKDETLRTMGVGHEPPVSDRPYLGIVIPSRIVDRASHAIDREILGALRALFFDSGLFPLVRYQDWNKPKVAVAAEVKKNDVTLGHVVTKVEGGRQDNARAPYQGFPQNF